RAAPRGARGQRADAPHRGRRDRLVQLHRARVHGEEGPARGRSRAAPRRHGAEHRSQPGAALTEAAVEAFGAQALRVVAILLLAWLLQAVAARLIRIFRNYMGRRTGPDEIT